MKHLILAILTTFSFINICARSPFDDIIRQAISNDREIKSQEARNEAAITFIDVDGPQIEYEHQWPNRGGEADEKWALSITQDFSWPGLYATRGKVASLERENASLTLMAITADRALSVKLLIIDIINSHRLHELYSAVGRNIARIDSMTRTAYDMGDATAIDLWKMKLAVLENRHSIATAEGDIRSLEGVLAATGVTFINGEAEFWHDYPLQPLTNPGELDPTSLTAALMANSASLGNARIKSTKMEAYPGFSVGYIHEFEENTHFNGFSVGIKLPSFSQKKKNRAARLEAEAMNFAASYELDKQKAEMQGLYEEALTLSRALDSYRELTGDESYLRLLDKSFRAGQLTVIDYLNEINLFISARQGFLDLEYRYNMALARLNRYRSLDF